MVVPGYRAIEWVLGSVTEALQPAGVDLTVAEVHRFTSSGSVLKCGKRLSSTEQIEPVNGLWHLEPGPYKVVYSEIVKVPDDCIGILLPRSTLLRIGATIFTAVWDPGYVGRGEGLLLVLNPHGIDLEVGCRVGQLVFIKLTSKPHATYSGAYQFERVGGRAHDASTNR